MLARLKEWIAYRGLIWNLVVHDPKVRYKSFVLGFLWSLLNPLFTMVVFTVLFTIMLLNNTIEKFPVFILCALLPRNFFSTSVMGSTLGIVANAHCRSRSTGA